MPSTPSISHGRKQLPDGTELDEQSNKQWQEEISTGFDRLVAYATEVDKRRKSSDSNSPGFNHDQSPAANTPTAGNSPPNSNTPEANRKSSVMLSRSRGSSEEMDQFGNRMSTLSMKFKRAPTNYHRYPGPPLRSPTSSLSSGSRHFAASSIPRDHDLISPPLATIDNNSATRASLIASSREPLPGENLPEHHFKKRYFAENTEDATNHDERDTDLHEESFGASQMNPKKRLSILGTNLNLQTESSSSKGLQFTSRHQRGLSRAHPNRFSREEYVEASVSKTVSQKDIDAKEKHKKSPVTTTLAAKTSSKEICKSISSDVQKCSALPNNTKT